MNRQDQEIAAKQRERRDVRRQQILAGAALAAMTVVAYVPALRAGFIWDDPDYVTKNPVLTEPGGLGRIWVPGNTPQYYPLVFTSYWLEHAVWGMRPGGYHAVNVLLHALSAVLLWRVLRRLGVPGALMCAAVFALHPVHVESVAWITERKNTLSGVFYLLAVLAYLRFDESRSRRAYAASILLFAAALLSKTVTATLPAALLLAVWWRRGRIARGDVAALLPFFVLGAAMGGLTAWLERTHVGAEGEDWVLSAAQRLLVAGRALWFYAGKLLWPAELTFVYPRWAPDAASLVQWWYPIGAAGVIALLWVLRGRIGRGPVAAVLFFAATLFPALGFFNVFPFLFSYVADHFQYLASIGVIVVVIGCAARLAQRSAGARRTGGAVCCAVLVVLGTLTWRQSRVYRDEESVWVDTLAKNETAWMAHFNLGLLLEKRGERAAAFEHYLAAVKYRPQHEKAHTLLGRDYTEHGRLDLAEKHYLAALAAEPKLINVHINLGNVYAAQGRADEALAQYESALGLRPDAPEVHFLLGNTRLARGEFAAALVHFELARAGMPENASIVGNVGVALTQLGRFDEAIAAFGEALALEATLLEPRLSLAALLARQGRHAEAAGTLRVGLRVAPGEAKLLGALAWILATCPDEAVRDGESAVLLAEQAVERTGGQDAAALNALAVGQAEAGRFAEAQRSAERARAAALREGNTRLVQQIEAEMEGFAQGRPHRTR